MIPGVEILAPLSSGGMGEVSLGRRVGALGFEKLVAVKRIREAFLHRDDVRAMFLDEARLLSRLSHPAIAQIYDFGEDGGALFIVMEYVAGVSFYELLAPGHAHLEPALAARLIAEVCRGLHAAHELTDLDGRRFDIVHRDVTPENLVLGFDGGVKILDFGIALMRDRLAPVTQIGSVRGKPAYLAPEQLRGEKIDRRTDLYGASAVLYELIAGRRCFVDRSFAVVPFSELGVACPRSLEAVVLRGLSDDPAGRFVDARAMAEALESSAADASAPAVFAEKSLSDHRKTHEARLKSLIVPLSPAPRSGGRVTEVDEPPPPPKSTRALLYVGTAIAASVLAAAFALRSSPDPEPKPSPPPSPPVLAVETKPEPIETKPVAPVETKPATPPRSKRPPRADRSPAELAKPATAKLSIGAKPYALITIDGKQIGPTPIVDLELSAGPHLIRAVEPDTDKVRYDQTIELGASEHKKLNIR